MRHIAVEGVIGAGKTSLCQMLAVDLGARVLLDPVEENPFLVGGFYHDPPRLAFDTQMFFLLSRLRQQRETGRLLAAGGGRVLSDYCFDKDAIFASLTLTGDDAALYNRVYRAFRAELATPDLVVYLRAPTDLLLQRIRRRDRAFERSLRDSHVEALNRAYEEFFTSFSGPAHVTVDVAQLDWTRTPEDYRSILRLVNQTIANIAEGQGTLELDVEAVPPGRRPGAAAPR